MTGDEERIKGLEDKGRGRVRIEDRASAMLILEEAGLHGLTGKGTPFATVSRTHSDLVTAGRAR